jgi:branched-chain amino acid transport system permease protein
VVAVLDLLVGALVYSNLLALMAVGLSLALITCRVSNFAHGDFAMVGVYAAYTLSAVAGLTPYAWIPAAFAFGGLVSLLAYLLVFEPLRERTDLVTLMVVSMALDMVLRYSLHVYADLMQQWLRVYTRLFMFDDFLVEAAGSRLPGVLPASTAVVAALLASLYVLLYKTRVGVAMRAAIENPGLAEALGVSVKRVFALSWFLSGALAATAGVFLPFRIMVSPDTGWSMLLPTFAAVTVGGIGSLGGSVLGAYLIGFSETVLAYQLAQVGISTAYRPLLTFAAIIATLLAYPRGLSGLWSGKGWSLRRRS